MKKAVGFIAANCALPMRPARLAGQRAGHLHEVRTLDQFGQRHSLHTASLRSRPRRDRGRRPAPPCRRARTTRRDGPRWPRARSTPSVLPSSWLPRMASRSPSGPLRSTRSATVIFFARSSMKPNACSATASAPRAGVVAHRDPRAGARVDVDDVVSSTCRADGKQSSCSARPTPARPATARRRPPTRRRCGSRPDSRARIPMRPSPVRPGAVRSSWTRSMSATSRMSPATGSVHRSKTSRGRSVIAHRGFRADGHGRAFGLAWAALNMSASAASTLL